MLYLGLLQGDRCGAVDHHHVVVAQQVIVVLVQLDGVQQAVALLQGFLGDQRLQRDGGEEGGGADAGHQTHGGHTVLHGIEHTDIHLFRLVDLIGEHHVGDGVVGLHFAGKQVLAVIRVGEGSNTHVQRDVDAVMLRGVGEAQKRANHLADAAIVVVHVGQGLVEVVVLGQGGLRAEDGRLVVDEALHVDVQRLRDLVERFDIDGDGAVFVLGKRRLAFVDHGGELLNGIAAAFPIFFDTLTNKIRKRAQKRHLLIME